MMTPQHIAEQLHWEYLKRRWRFENLLINHKRKWPAGYVEWQQGWLDECKRQAQRSRARELWANDWC